MTRVLVVFYSTYGHIAKLAKAQAEGAAAVAGVEVRVRRVAETLSEEILTKMHALDAQKAWHPEFEVATPADLEWADAVIWGSPTRFGNITAQMKTFIDSLGGLWAQGKLVGKVAAAFTSSATQHGGQETTIVCGFWPFFAHHGFVIVGLPYSFAGQMGVDEMKGGSPYGASTIAGGDGSRQPSDVEVEGAKFQGKHVATIASQLVKGRL
eukprot:TRINITY_DN13020_c0_g1_i1.p1 TRINITY_DN13020_c0_g1~~TRINITY_DN13020_c0_g1_i1.p1  ORF type:complete len:221 (-),score=57.84 TRINITY_DN13020_c0_g1_i1:35-664(-)